MEGVNNNKGEYMLLGNDKNDKPEEAEPVTENKPDNTTAKRGRKAGNRLDEDYKLEIAERIDKEADVSILNGEIHKFITYDKLKRIAAHFEVAASTAERYTVEYTNVKIDRDHRSCRTPNPLNKRRKSTEIREEVVDLLSTTNLSQKEIADICGVSVAFISNNFREKKSKDYVKRPKELGKGGDEEVAKKTNRKRKELRKIKNEQESKTRRASSTETPTEEATTSVKELVKDIEVPKEAPVPAPVVQQPKPEPKKIVRYSCNCGFLRLESYKGKECSVCKSICREVDENFVAVPVQKKPVVVEEKNTEERKTELVSVTPAVSGYKTPTVPEPEDKPDTLIDLLDCRAVSRIVADTYLDVMEFTNRHGMPCRIGVFENEFTPEMYKDHKAQKEICFEFLKQNLKFNEAGMANKTIRLYVTGNNSGYGAIVHACYKMKVNLTAMYYDNRTRTYDPDPILDDFPTYHEFGLGVSAIAKTFGNNLYRYNCTMRDIEQASNVLYIAYCKENIKNTECTKNIAIICNAPDQFKGLRRKIMDIADPIDNPFQGFEMETHKFNFNSNGDVIKNETISVFTS